MSRSSPTASPESQCDSFIRPDGRRNVMTVDEVCHYLNSGKTPDATEKPKLAKGPNVVELVTSDLLNSFQDSKMIDNHGKSYLPISECNRILNNDIMKALISETHPGAAEAELRKILEDAKERPKILAILLLIENKDLSYLSAFVDEEIVDSHLPLYYTVSDIDAGYRTSQSGKTTDLFGSWKTNDRLLFHYYQDVVCVPIFDLNPDETTPLYLHSRTQLPWLSYVHKARGGSGIIHRVEIHSEHLRFRTGQPHRLPLCFALKEMMAANKDNYNKELQAFQKTRAKLGDVKHLARLLLAFEYGRNYYLMFEWADGNLDEFWTDNPLPPEHSTEKRRWAATQCLGLAAALRKIHGCATWRVDGAGKPTRSEDDRDWGRHGDIKPENILWFSSYGEDKDFLVLSDLGLTRFHSQATRSIVPPDNLDGYTMTYRSPELDTSQPIGRSYDIWSLGCVFLEFCTWWLRGSHDVHSFKAQRTDGRTTELIEEDNFFLTSKSNESVDAELHPAVGKHIGQLRESLTDDIFAGPMLDLIEEEMLVVSQDDRGTIDVVYRAISDIVTNVQQALG